MLFLVPFLVVLLNVPSAASHSWPDNPFPRRRTEANLPTTCVVDENGGTSWQAGVPGASAGDEICGKDSMGRDIQNLRPSSYLSNPCTFTRASSPYDHLHPMAKVKQGGHMCVTWASNAHATDGKRNLGGGVKLAISSKAEPSMADFDAGIISYVPYEKFQGALIEMPSDLSPGTYTMLFAWYWPVGNGPKFLNQNANAHLYARCMDIVITTQDDPTAMRLGSTYSDKYLPSSCKDPGSPVFAQSTQPTCTAEPCIGGYATTAFSGWPTDNPTTTSSVPTSAPTTAANPNAPGGDNNNANEGCLRCEQCTTSQDCPPHSYCKTNGVCQGYPDWTLFDLTGQCCTNPRHPHGGGCAKRNVPCATLVHAADPWCATHDWDRLCNRQCVASPVMRQACGGGTPPVPTVSNPNASVKTVANKQSSTVTYWVAGGSAAGVFALSALIILRGRSSSRHRLKQQASSSLALSSSGSSVDADMLEEGKSNNSRIPMRMQLSVKLVSREVQRVHKQMQRVQSGMIRLQRDILRQRDGEASSALLEEQEGNKERRAGRHRRTASI